MGQASTRRFGVRDALILVSATGVGLVPARPFLADAAASLATVDWALLADGYYWRSTLLEMPSSFLEPSILGLWSFAVSSVLHRSPSAIWITSRRGQVATLAQDASALAFPLLLAWSIAVLVLQLTRPRPPGRDMARQPGVWACAVTLIVVAASSWIEATARGPSIPPIVIPIGVGLAWLALAIARHPFGVPSWPDRLGRVVGILWIASAVPLAIWAVLCR